MGELCRGGLTPSPCTYTLHQTSTTTTLNCFMTNAQNILNKQCELQALVAHNDDHFLGITEPWCTDYVNDSELYLKGYNLFHADKKSGTGGGVLLYLHVSLSATLCVPLMDFNIDDDLWCSVMLKDKEQLLIGIVYRSPSSSDTNNGRLLSAIESINNLNYLSRVLLFGDLMSQV